MSAQDGAGPPPPARGGAGPQAATIALPIRAPEHSILQRVRSNRLLDQMRHSDSALQVRRTSRLLGDMAAITSVLTMNLCDMMFRFYSGQSETVVRQRHRTSLQAIEIINDLCTQPLVLKEWGFSEEHCHLATASLGTSPALPECSTVSPIRLTCAPRSRSRRSSTRRRSSTPCSSSCLARSSRR